MLNQRWVFKSAKCKNLGKICITRKSWPFMIRKTWPFVKWIIVFCFKLRHLTYYKYCVEIMFCWLIIKYFESKAGRERKTKRKRESSKLWDMWNILTKDGIYFSYLKWICSSKEKYHKSQDEYLGNIVGLHSISYLHIYIYIYIYIYIPRKEWRPPLHFGVEAIEKGAFGSHSTKVAYLTLLIYIYIYIYIYILVFIYI